MLDILQSQMLNLGVRVQQQNVVSIIILRLLVPFDPQSNDFTNWYTVEPHSSKAHFNVMPRLLELFANPPEFRAFFLKKLL